MRIQILASLIALALCPALVLGAPAEQSTAAARAAERQRHVEVLHAKASAEGIDLATTPAWEAVPALGLTPIEPGPGLPSLQSLNLTWAQLIDRRPPVAATDDDAGLASRDVEKRWVSYCTYNDPINWSDSEHCWSYLYGLGSTVCGVNNGGVFCRSGAVSWLGITEDQGYHTTSCRDISDSGRWVLDYCWSNSQRVEGAHSAWANNMIYVVVMD